MENPFLDQRVAFLGKLGGLSRAEASTLVRRLGGKVVGPKSERIDLLVLGAEELLQVDDIEPTSAGEVISESELWRRLGVLPEADIERKLYTPAMAADILRLPASLIRRWHNSGFIQAAQTVHRLPYFTYEELAFAKKLHELQQSLGSTDEVRKQWQAWAARFPELERPLAQLDLVSEHGRWLLRRSGTLMDAQGQLFFDFAPVDNEQPPPILSFPGGDTTSPITAEQYVAQAGEWELQGDFSSAADAYRSALAAGGPSAELCVQLGICLTAGGEHAAARERFFMALELDPLHLEARANLGCCLWELKHTDLALAAWRGALAIFPDYADVHLHLAQSLDELHQTHEAEPHWRRFAELAPLSPWYALAAQRLNLEVEPSADEDNEAPIQDFNDDHLSPTPR